MPGIFTVSLDFELHWGVFDKKDRDQRSACYQNTLKLIPQLLALFEKYQVSVTWATVGSLFAKDEEEWNSLKPKTKPEYHNKTYSAYNWVNKNGLSENAKWAHFAPEMIKLILQHPAQELGTHTFSHYYCMEPQDNTEAFTEDLKAAKEAARKFGNQPISLVFPRNQFNPYFLNACYSEGIKTVRSNPDNWFWTPIPDKGSNIIRKIFRTGDGYIRMGNRTSYPLSSIKAIANEPLQLPASRLFRAWQPKYQFMNKLRLKRTISELTYAAKQNECYHLWWHPENFGDFPSKNLADLEVVLQQYQLLKKTYGMTSWTMGDYATNLLK